MNLFWLVPHSQYVSLQVFKGTSHPGPDRLLKGTGKNLWYVKCRTPTDAVRPALRELLLQSVAASNLVV